MRFAELNNPPLSIKPPLLEKNEPPGGLIEDLRCMENPTICAKSHHCKTLYTTPTWQSQLKADAIHVCPCSAGFEVLFILNWVTKNNNKLYNKMKMKDPYKRSVC